MTDQKTKKEETESLNDKKEDDLPFCTTAPSAEHARALEDDEPCDDGRSGD